MTRFLAAALATLFVGKIPKAPGTFGSLLAVLIWWAIMPLSFEIQQTLIVAAFFVGLLATFYYEKLNHKHDPKEVVVDELIGMWICLLGAPKHWLLFTLGFLLFRLFDIAKPFPIGWVDRRVPGALGTILDDVLAGFVAMILLRFLFFPGGLFGIIY